MTTGRSDRTEPLTPRTIAGYVPMSAQLAAEMKRIADAHAEEVAAVAAILDAYFREIADDE